MPGLPHARGGVSCHWQEGSICYPSSPRPWGCFFGSRRLDDGDRVFPTPVGVFPSSAGMLRGLPRLPHARGGVSSELVAEVRALRSSPRPWGCFSTGAGISVSPNVFPTPVGVFPFPTSALWPELGLPHARGGVSKLRDANSKMDSSSPRPWGCFRTEKDLMMRSDVFPTLVGVFLGQTAGYEIATGLPHARGGVSTSGSTTPPAPPSSPRPWGCFQLAAQGMVYVEVFPTPVGVFPLSSAVRWCRCGLPHARGGVSPVFWISCWPRRSSPRPWGCFPRSSRLR